MALYFQPSTIDACAVGISLVPGPRGVAVTVTGAGLSRFKHVIENPDKVLELLASRISPAPPDGPVGGVLAIIRAHLSRGQRAALSRAVGKRRSGGAVGQPLLVGCVCPTAPGGRCRLQTSRPLRIRSAYHGDRELAEQTAREDARDYAERSGYNVIR